ncbi:hypothetical protein BA953_24785 (plasmid) [Vibrio coralliilyticus]|nr:hypothetical protein BA953_24785 [Vibrio coralliilyticus]
MTRNHFEAIEDIRGVIKLQPFFPPTSAEDKCNAVQQHDSIGRRQATFYRTGLSDKASKLKLTLQADTTLFWPLMVFRVDEGLTDWVSTAGINGLVYGFHTHG